MRTLALLLLGCCAYPLAASAAPVVVSPPVDRLAPVTNDFPRRGPAISPHDTWAALTRGTDLALGKPYRFARRPDYAVTDDPGDATQLTDGKIIPGDHIWYSKQAVGWRGCEPPALVCIDLGKVQPIDRVVAHVQGGGAHQASLRYPLRFDVLVSDDGQTYHLVDSVSKRQFADQQGSLYDLPEDDGAWPPGRPHTQAFNFGNLHTRGRYVALQMTFATPYNAIDEIAVMRGDFDPAQVTFDPKYDTRLVLDGVEALYPNRYLYLPTNVCGGFSIAVRDSRQDRSRPVTFHFILPVGVKLSWSGSPDPMPCRPLQQAGRPCLDYTVTVTKPASTLGYFYLQGRPGVTGEMTYYAVCGNVTQPAQHVPLLPVAIPQAPPLKQLFLALGWTGLDLQTRWPGGAAVFRHFGFTYASVGSWELPAIYNDPATAASQRWLDQQARPAGLKVCMTDSPFHIMMALWGKEPDFSAAYGEVSPPDKQLCLSYRGKYYHKEIDRIVQRYRYRKPDVVLFDVECFGHAVAHVQKCKICRRLLAQRKCTPQELATDLFAQMSFDIADALNHAADELGRPHPLIGYYHLGPGQVYQGAMDFSKMYPRGVQLANPEIYVRCWPPAVADIVRRDKAAAPSGCQIIGWLSPGTLNWEGECPPPRLFDSLMEMFFNGAIGAAYYTAENLGTGDLLAQAQAATVVAPVEDIIAHSALVSGVKCVAGDGHVSAIRAGKEMLLLVGEFKHLGPQQVTVQVPVAEPVQVVDLFTRRPVTTLSPGHNLLTVTISGAYRTRPFYIGNDWPRRNG